MCRRWGSLIMGHRVRWGSWLSPAVEGQLQQSPGKGQAAEVPGKRCRVPLCKGPLSLSPGTCVPAQGSSAGVGQDRGTLNGDIHESWSHVNKPVSGRGMWGAPGCAPSLPVSLSAQRMTTVGGAERTNNGPIAACPWHGLQRGRTVLGGGWEGAKCQCCAGLSSAHPAEEKGQGVSSAAIPFGHTDTSRSLIVGGCMEKRMPGMQDSWGWMLWSILGWQRAWHQVAR